MKNLLVRKFNSKTMKGIVFNILNEMVEEQFGMAAWDGLLDAVGSEGIYVATETYPDEELLALVAAAEQEVDSTPMEGFDPDAVDAILGLRERGLRSVVLMPLGYREEAGDWLLPMPKVRKSRDAIVTEINLNDDTVEGLRLKDRPVFSVQYHPEAAPGPNDADVLFNQFYEMVAANAG